MKQTIKVFAHTKREDNPINKTFKVTAVELGDNVSILTLTEIEPKTCKWRWGKHSLFNEYVGLAECGKIADFPMCRLDSGEVNYCEDCGGKIEVVE